MTSPGQSQAVSTGAGSSAAVTSAGPSSAVVGTTFVSMRADGGVETVTGSATVPASEVSASTTRWVSSSLCLSLWGFGGRGKLMHFRGDLGMNRFVTVTLTDGQTVV